ncbi:MULTISPECIES: imelysin family protein [unclassified Ruegeria]|uniref:imelysin family protein n=1 Tax=unclassified Ruegeria TaxID=2625375 RepID=UPI0014893ACD|nr:MULTISPECIES: imelysin family protein [unclassified Ruegeria]
MRLATLTASLLLPATLFAQDLEQVTRTHILPRFAQLATASDALADTARAECDPQAPQLRQAYHAAFDAWISASHLRFGPSEVEDRAFALAFWPDTKGFTGKVLSQLIATADPVIHTPEDFAETSVAGRGFFALERLLYDEDLAAQAEADYRCSLIRAISVDIDRNADAINADWQSYALLLEQPGENSPYRNTDEATQEIYKALITGLEFTGNTRLGRPLGSFDRPRPNRAEARRSERSARHVVLSLIALRDLAAHLALDHPDVATPLEAGFADAIERAQALDDPALAGVADPAARFRIEALQQAVLDIHATASGALGPKLGISAGFNSLDGD